MTKIKLSSGLVHELATDVGDAIRKNKETIDLWENLTLIGRNEFICWIEDVKQKETRVKRIMRLIEALHEGKRRPCCWPGCAHRTDKIKKPTIKINR